MRSVWHNSIMSCTRCKWRDVGDKAGVDHIMGGCPRGSRGVYIMEDSSGV